MSKRHPVSIRPRSPHLVPLGVLTALTLSGCADIAGPSAEPAQGKGSELLMLASLSGVEADMVGALLADLNDRVIPSLPDGSARQELADAFLVLAMALGVMTSPDGTVHDPQASLEAASSALVRYGAAVAGDAAAQAELESVKLSLDAVQVGLGQ